MLTVLAAHAIGAALAPILFSILGRKFFYFLAAIPLASFFWVLYQIVQNSHPAIAYNWIPELSMHIDLKMDRLSAILALLVTSVGSLVLAYCAKYFTQNDKVGGFGAQLLAFSGVMFGLVTADNLLILFVFWEATSVLSYLLIGHSGHKIAARKAALQAMIVTTFGGLAMFTGFIILGEIRDTYTISEILATQSSNSTVEAIAILLILIGAISKSALIPLHFWLPAAMAAPTPVSAYLHAAAMVKAGIYLVARLAPGFSETTFWLPTIFSLGLLTMLLAGIKAVKQTDLKLLLACGTVSQLGFITIMVGIGTYNAAIAGLSLLIGHAMFKATLFLVTGIIDHQAGTRDIRKLSGVAKSAPLLALVATIAAASMSGIPPFTGFLAKEAAYEVLLERSQNFWGISALIIVVLSSAITFAYSARFIYGAFGLKSNISVTNFPKISLKFLLPAAVLAAGTIFFGLAANLLEALISPYVKEAYPYPEHKIHLALWHGFTPTLALTLVTFILGTIVFRYSKSLIFFNKSIKSSFSGENIYFKTIQSLNSFAIWLTGKTQRGSLSIYLAVIIVVATISTATSMLISGGYPTKFYWYDNIAQPIVLIISAATIFAAVKARKRFTAILLVGVTGYVMAIIFVLQGAPDLALTQVLVETVTLVSLILVFRILPQEVLSKNYQEFKIIRAVIALFFGVVICFAALYVIPSRQSLPVSLEFPELAYYVGGGKNIVNVILVDLRAWDTMGEIAVLTVAATGIASLIFHKRKQAVFDRSKDVASGSIGRKHRFHNGSTGAALKVLARRFSSNKKSFWLVAGRTLAPEQRYIILEIITRLLFHSMIVVSIFFLVAGHDVPGGGFAGGLLVGIAITLRYLAGGRYELNETIPLDAGPILGVGLLLSTFTALVPLFFGGNVLESTILNFDLYFLGEIKIVTSIFFDIGVYLIVIGLMLDVLRSLGSEIDFQMDNMHDIEISGGE